LYLAPVAASRPRPPKELKGFVKVALDPGERRTVSFTLDERAFAFFDDAAGGWITEAGDYEILIGASAEDIRLSTKVRLT
ncbi:MAG TPA: fibronectin type III-like domain-contianing protein, partial [Caulobacteraceae bacterium]|nr:fibronectin type III-like domain-contianing protein [Caulobacteraceae bacterium]